jgi:DNA-binding GntR family transcriptional regulator
VDFSNPFRLITNGVEGSVLALLAGGDRAYTSREIERTLDARSYEPIRLALKRLEAQGIITAEPAGMRAVLYRFNGEHLAAPYVRGIALLRQQTMTLSALATRWTGNDARVLEYGLEELSGLAGTEPVLAGAARDGIDLTARSFRAVFKAASRR